MDWRKRSLKLGEFLIIFALADLIARTVFSVRWINSMVIVLEAVSGVALIVVSKVDLFWLNH